VTRILVLYNQPADPAAFDRYFSETHTPIAKKIPGLRSLTVSAAPPSLMAGEKAPHLIAQLDFDSQADLQAALASPEGQAALADMANYAQAGATVLTFDTRIA
jgi:uncharacterized protein (TIGR02118 family)